MKVKWTWKEFGLSVLMGAGVVVGMALLAKIDMLTSFGFMATNLLPGYLTVGQALLAGIAAFATNLLIAQMR